MDTDPSKLVLKPSFVRLHLGALLYLLVVIVIGWIVKALLFGARPEPVAAWLLVVGIGTALLASPYTLRRYTIEIADGMVYGPDLFSGREVIPLREIDRTRSEHRSVLQLLFGRQTIRSMSGRKIYVNRWWYRPDELSVFLEAVRTGETYPAARGAGWS